MPRPNVNKPRQVTWYLIRVLLLLSFLLFTAFAIVLLQWELTNGKYSELTTGHRVEFGLVLTDYERSKYLDQSLVPKIKILSVLEYTEQCSIVYALAIYPRGGSDSATVGYYYMLHHANNEWLVTDVIKFGSDVKQPSC